MKLSSILWVLAVLLAAGLGSAASVSAPEFYAQLKRPDWAPPAWLFGPVWTVLYLMIAASIVRFLHVGGAHQRFAMMLFGAQLIANALWSWLFFAWRSGAGALLCIVVLLLLLSLTIRLFYRADPLSAWLLLPYAFWVSFAALLNAAVWSGNPSLL